MKDDIIQFLEGIRNELDTRTSVPHLPGIIQRIDRKIAELSAPPTNEEHAPDPEPELLPVKPVADDTPETPGAESVTETGGQDHAATGTIEVPIAPSLPNKEA